MNETTTVIPTKFRQYLHVERYGNDEVQGIELGEIFIFPKLDGTNASAWAISSSPEEWDYSLGSRTRELSLTADNAGFFAHARESEDDGLGRRFLRFFNQHPNLRLYGEWLVPHTLKTYRDEVWRRFWVFDVFNNATNQYLSYPEYKGLMDEFQFDYIPPLRIIKNGSYEYFIDCLGKNDFFIRDGAGVGEGIVLKNYNYTNRFGNLAFAKFVTSEFKEKHHREMGAPESAKTLTEELICQEFLTSSMVEKIYAKIMNECDGWNSRYIPRLLETAYHDLIVEEMYNAQKKHKNASINFGVLHHFAVSRVKELLPHVF